jgi:putative serine protease PepD
VSNRLLAGAAAIALAAFGAVIGAVIYASSAGGRTTTLVSTVTSGGPGQEIAATTGLTATEIFRRSYQGVVDITVGQTSSFSFGRGGSQGSTGEGSGFVYDTKGDILTNQHVIAGASSISVRFWNGSVYKAHLVGADSSTDLAIVKVSAPSSILHPLTLGNSGTVQVGDGVVAIGSPFGLAETMTSGIVSALHRAISSPNQNFTIADSIQTDAPINHGNSGGPLLNASGQVIGVNTQIQSSSGGSEGVGFAVPSNTIRSVAAKLVVGQKIAHAYLGISVQDASTAANATAGALAGNVKAGTPAARAGLKSGDVIVRMEGTQINSSEDLTRTIDSKQPGDKLAVTFLRGGKPHTVTVTLGTRPVVSS